MVVIEDSSQLRYTGIFDKPCGMHSLSRPTPGLDQGVFIKTVKKMAPAGKAGAIWNHIWQQTPQQVTGYEQITTTWLYVNPYYGGGQFAPSFIPDA